MEPRDKGTSIIDVPCNRGGLKAHGNYLDGVVIAALLAFGWRYSARLEPALKMLRSFIPNIQVSGK